MTTTSEPRPRFTCGTCQDWGTVVPRTGGRPVPCPDDCPTARKLQGR